jgi:hypothetical protein
VYPRFLFLSKGEEDRTNSALHFLINRKNREELIVLLPRNAENPTRENIDGRKANDLINRYGLAYSRAGAPLFKTDIRAWFG